jgi:hypothetical protein
MSQMAWKFLEYWHCEEILNGHSEGKEGTWGRSRQVSLEAGAITPSEMQPCGTRDMSLGAGPPLCPGTALGMEEADIVVQEITRG